MSVYQVAIENHIYQVNISDGRCTVDGAAVDPKVVSLNRNGLHLIHHGRKVLEFFLNPLGDDNYQLVMQGGRHVNTTIFSRSKKRSRAGVVEKQDQRLVAPMPGLVLEVTARVGDLVEPDQTLVILESMKMQMRLRTQRGGKIAKIKVRPGMQVEKGALLIQFAPSNPQGENHE